jgi:hypothetical protein
MQLKEQQAGGRIHGRLANKSQTDICKLGANQAGPGRNLIIKGG